MYPNEGVGRSNYAESPVCMPAPPPGSPVAEAFDRVVRTQSMIGERLYALRDRLAIVLRNDPPTKDGSTASPREVGQSDLHQALLNMGDTNVDLTEQLESILRRLTV